MNEIWSQLPRDLVRKVLDHVDAATRRDLGLAPRKLPPTDLQIQFEPSSRSPLNASDDEFLYVKMCLGDEVTFFKMFTPSDDRIVITYIWQRFCKSGDLRSYEIIFDDPELSEGSFVKIIVNKYG